MKLYHTRLCTYNPDTVPEEDFVTDFEIGKDLTITQLEAKAGLEPNICYYNRACLDDDDSPTRLIIDYGSWSWFLVITGTQEELKELINLWFSRQ